MDDVAKWRRKGNPLRVWPDVLAHKMHLPTRLQAWACSLRGDHSYRIWY